jgi:hypothetical protein
MSKLSFKAVAAAALIGFAAMTAAVPAEAGGWHGHHGGGGGNAFGFGLLGFGLGAIVGSALTPQTVYVAPPAPPPPPAYPVAYGPPAWTPEWYSYCSYRYRTFNPQTGYFIGWDGYPRFCY